MGITKLFELDEFLNYTLKFLYEVIRRGSKDLFDLDDYLNYSSSNYVSFTVCLRQLDWHLYEIAKKDSRN